MATPAGQVPSEGLLTMIDAVLAYDTMARLAGLAILGSRLRVYRGSQLQDDIMASPRWD